MMRRDHRKTVAGFFLITGFMLIFSSSYGQVFKTQREGFELAFPGDTSVERKALFLTDDQIAKIEPLAKAKLESKLVTYYVGSRADSITGFAFFETSVVRTKPETFMVVVRPDGLVKLVEILAFYEPLDYLPTPRWLKLFNDKMLDDQLWPKRGIHNITGATLTVQSITQGVRKILAIYQVAINKEKHP
jgi:hypothetical protein